MTSAFAFGTLPISDARREQLLRAAKYNDKATFQSPSDADNHWIAQAGVWASAAEHARAVSKDTTLFRGLTKVREEYERRLPRGALGRDDLSDTLRRFYGDAALYHLIDKNEKKRAKARLQKFNRRQRQLALGSAQRSRRRLNIDTGAAAHDADMFPVPSSSSSSTESLPPLPPPPTIATTSTSSNGEASSMEIDADSNLVRVLARIGFYLVILASLLAAVLQRTLMWISLLQPMPSIPLLALTDSGTDAVVVQPTPTAPVSSLHHEALLSRLMSSISLRLSPLVGAPAEGTSFTNTTSQPADAATGPTINSGSSAQAAASAAVEAGPVVSATEDKIPSGPSRRDPRPAKRSYWAPPVLDIDRADEYRTKRIKSLEKRVLAASSEPRRKKSGGASSSKTSDSSA
ncbi:hypothetical protein MIND_01235300 [Mycena indigotica]|uniref:Uncharacterized protein n=1 Tax=Mycena indigotica TaxID=2126181 RepID=A0A8H6VXS5_9AGAR|nr:uncharacterized protein MIND_01235300 [Mycena indigotica]KAF7292089.1 hypothetical protein MIND_01235300 [Mycena indigotica]